MRGRGNPASGSWTVRLLNLPINKQGQRSKDRENSLEFSMCEFNFLPTRYIHQSWLATIRRGKLLRKLSYCRRSEQRVSRYLLSEFELDGQYWFDFSNSCNSIALLDGNKLAQLVLYAGLAVNARRIQGTILGKDVLKLKRDLGEDSYLFALKGASLSNLTSEVASMPTYSKCMAVQSKICGIKCLATVFPDGTPALTKRMLLKLPVTWCNHFSALDITASDRDALLELVRRIFVKVVSL